MQAKRFKTICSVTMLLALFAAVSLFAQDQYPDGTQYQDQGQYQNPGQSQNQGPYQDPGQYQNQGQYAAQDPNQSDPPARVARLTYEKGAVSVQPSGSDQWSDAQPNYPLVSGDRVYVDDAGRAELQTGQTVIRLGSGADLTLTSLTQNYVQLGLAQGIVRLRTFGLDEGGTVELDTPNGAITVLRPGDIRVHSSPEDGGTVITVNTGEIQLSGPELSQRVEPGHAVRLTGSNPVQLVNVGMSGYDDFDRWSISRDHHILNSESAQYVSRDMIGYDDLDENGSWTTTPDYGPMWYPSAVPSGWVPYHYGHWAYIAPWGWTWIDDAPWGFAPFHYGRWAYYGNRWGWVPGPVSVFPVYSPALVAFVGGPHFGIGIGFGGVGLSAWFPLGVGEPFVPWYRCSPGYVTRVNVTNVNIVRIHNTTIVNNYTSFINNARTVNSVNNLRMSNIHYANQTNAVTAVNARDFTSGRPVATSAVRVDPAQLRNAQVDNRMVAQVRPAAGAIQRPVASRAVPVPGARPLVLTKAGPAPAVAGARPITNAGNRPLGEANQRPVSGFAGNAPAARPNSNYGGAPPVNSFAPAAANRPNGQPASTRPLITAPGAPNANGANRLPPPNASHGYSGQQALPARDAQGRPIGGSQGAYRPPEQQVPTQQRPSATYQQQRPTNQAPVQQQAPQYQQRPPQYQQGAPPYLQRAPQAPVQQRPTNPAPVQQQAPQYQQRMPQAPVQQQAPQYEQRPPQYQQRAPQAPMQQRPEYQPRPQAQPRAQQERPAPREDRSAPKEERPRK